MKKSKRNESRKFTKLDITVLITLVSEILLFLLYNFLMKTYFLGRYVSALFVERDMMKFFNPFFDYSIYCSYMLFFKGTKNIF